MTSFFRSWILFPACVLTLVAGACAKPSVQEQFVRSDEARMGVYAFELDLDSSSRSYDIYLCLGDGVSPRCRQAGREGAVPQRRGA